MIYGWLIDRLTDSTVAEEWPSYRHGFNYSCLIDWLTGFTVRKLTNVLIAYCVIHWLTEILYYWLYCLRVFKLTEWFMADWWTDWLTHLSEDWLTYRIVYRWLIDLLTLLSEVLTNWLNDLWLPRTDKLTECSLGNTMYIHLSTKILYDWLFCLKVYKLTEWFMTIIDWLTD